VLYLSQEILLIYCLLFSRYTVD